jgi:hypothetical protein
MTDWVLGIGLKSCVYRTHGATICISEEISNTVSRGARVLKNFGTPFATTFTYKMRSGGKEN